MAERQNISDQSARGNRIYLRGMPEKQNVSSQRGRNRKFLPTAAEETEHFCAE
jgi:hypothetical protein